jgi:ABC-type antimicrobial peptide transport system permease subunit
VPIGGVTILSDRVARNLNQERLVAALTSIFGLLAVALAALGLFGVMSYAVTQRTEEFGIRMALGAPRARVITAVLRDALRVVALGLAAGIPAVWLGSRLLTTLLFGITVGDPTTLVVAAVALTLLALVAAGAPAWRASRVDPVLALRQE